MNEKKREEEFIEEVRRTLDESTEALDTGTTARLSRARKQALEGQGERAARSRGWYRSPLAGLAAASVLVIVGALYFSSIGGFSANGSVEDVELLASTEELTLLEELDFYTWLASDEDYTG